MLPTENGHKKDHKKALFPVCFFWRGTLTARGKKLTARRKRLALLATPSNSLAHGW